MESPQSVVSPFKNSSLYSEPEKQNLDLFTKTTNFTPKESEPFIGVLKVHIHHAREIQNICIYQKQDVYAKVCLTSNPEKSLTTKTINGGGKNPIFNETLQVKVPKIEDSSLKCEIFMLSRVRNYLEDQLLGFALIPLSEILIQNGSKLEKEFTLSSTDLFHSPSGFVHMSLSYAGASPEVIAVPAAVPPPAATDPVELDRIEFPDPNLVTENHMMVSEYIGLSSESLVSSESDDLEPPPVVVEETPKPDSPPTSVSTNGSECSSVPRILKFGNQESKLVSKVDIDGDRKVVQQDFVDLYMKSMQQFTESLAKMKLPLDVEKERADSGNSSSDQNVVTPNSTQSRVFYGSRAFF